MKAHGIMFHHFHDDRHPSGQGSISAVEFQGVIRWLRRNYRLLSAYDFYELALAGNLDENDTCITFDDSLLCQYDIAAPVLNEEQLTAFYFVYSSAFSENPDMLEIYRYFRSTEYEDFGAFCDEFMAKAAIQNPSVMSDALRDFKPESFLSEFPFYSIKDRLFRYVRDVVLTTEQYANVMKDLMSEHGFDVDRIIPLLFMSQQHLLDLQSRGNVIGMHSHTHPLNMAELPVHDQRHEYAANFAFLKSVLFEDPTTMSHPMGRYSSDTLEILFELGVRLGFRSSMNIKHAPSLLEIPREDHVNVLEKMRQ